MNIIDFDGNIEPQEDKQPKNCEVVTAADFAARLEATRGRTKRLTAGFPKASVLKAHVDPFNTAYEAQADIVA